MMPFAPLRLSMMMFWPSARDTGSAMARATVSMVPPAGCGMSIRMGRAGHESVCADAKTVIAVPSKIRNDAIEKRNTSGSLRACKCKRVYGFCSHVTGLSKTSFRLDAGLAYYPGPLGDLAAYHRSELLGTRPRRFGAFGGEPFTRRWRLQYAFKLAAEPSDHDRWRARRRENTVPGALVVVLEARLGDARELGRNPRALAACYRKRLEPAGPHKLQRRRHRSEVELDLSREQRSHGRSAPLIGHMDEA